jgi:TonB family protein
MPFDLRARLPARFSGLLLSGLLLLPALILAAEPQEKPAIPPEVLKSAARLYEIHQYGESAAEFARANTLAGGACGECLVGEARAYGAGGRHAEALAAAREAIRVGSVTAVLAEAHYLVGTQLILGSAPKEPDGKTLAEAEGDLRKAVELDGERQIYRLTLAGVLLHENHPEEALTLARPIVASPVENLSRRARITVCDARAKLSAEGRGPASSTETPGEVMRLGPNSSGPTADSVSRPELISRVLPQYTEAARKSRIEGAVALDSIIDEEGCVRSLKVVRSLDPGLDAAALIAARQWVFQPAMLKGKPVKVYYSVTVNFQLDKNKPGKP